MKRTVFIIFILSLILVMSGVVYILAEKNGLLGDSTLFNNSSEKNQIMPTFTTSEEETDDTQTTTTDPSLPSSPTWYWSELTEQLTQVEEKRAIVTDTLLQKLSTVTTTQSFDLSNFTEQKAKKAITSETLLKDVSPQQLEKSESPTYFTSYTSKANEQVRWTNISQKIVQLEQARQKIIDILIRRKSTSPQKRLLPEISNN
jgi:HD superfamily phosphohydrolase